MIRVRGMTTQAPIGGPVGRRVAIGIGANLDDPEARVRAAVAALCSAPWLRQARASGLYRTRPVGPVAQPDFINAAVIGRSDSPASKILEALRTLEEAAGRRREVRWGPRRLDLDLLMVGDELHDAPGLRVPHPRMHERAFVLIPLADLAPGWRHPRLAARIDTLAARCHDAAGVVRLADTTGKAMAT